MGNKASVLFGAGPQNVLSDSEEHASGGGTSQAAAAQRALSGGDNSNSSNSSARPVALSAEEQADAKRYSELFGGKPRVKSSGAAPSSKRKTGSRQHKKKQRFDEDDDSDNGYDGRNNAGGEQGDSGGGGDGDGSAPGSPYRGKAAWAVGTAAEGNGKGKGKESAPQAVSEEERRQQVIQAVSAKIEDLEKEKTGNNDAADGGGAGGSNVVEQEEGALVPVGAKGSATEAARARAAVSNALFAGAPQNAPASQELLVGPSGASVKGGAGGAGVVADLPPATARTASPRPAPQRNFKVKN